jgi:hypothetical protein
LYSRPDAVFVLTSIPLKCGELLSKAESSDAPAPVQVASLAPLPQESDAAAQLRVEMREVMTFPLAAVPDKPGHRLGCKGMQAKHPSWPEVRPGAHITFCLSFRPPVK